MTLRNARILSSCNDASNKQKQRMNVNINIDEKTIPTPSVQTIPIQQASAYPQVNPIYQQTPQATNFTTPMQQQPEQSTFPSVAANPLPSRGGSSLVRDEPIITRDVNLEQDFAKDMKIADLETKNKFLNMLLIVFQNNPLYVNSYVVCNAQLLMEMIKLLTKCDRVDLVLNEDVACGGCTGDDKLIYLSKILVVNGDESKELKYAFNDVYSKLISYGLSLKVVC